ncbi:MAG: shikimate dehydrogenase [Casimicrobiaceae bacterium]
MAIDSRQLQKITGATRLFAIVGDPIAQVRSPEMFNVTFHSAGIDAIMVPLHVRAKDLSAVMNAAMRLGNLDGIVVTIPHKTAAVTFADRLLPTARQVGAINALARQLDGTWTGELFDGQGFLAGIRRAGCNLVGRSAIVVGCGGAGSAIAFALASAGMRSLALYDIERSRVDSLAARVTACYSSLAIRVGGVSEDCDLVVNATPLGMVQHDPLPIALDRIPRTAWVADLVMKPEITPLLIAARARGHPIMLGAETLKHQIEPISRFFGLRLS